MFSSLQDLESEWILLLMSLTMPYPDLYADIIRAPLDRRSAGRNAGQLAPPGSPSNLLTKIVYLAQLFHDQKLHTDSAPLKKKKKKKWLESGIERHSALGFHNLIWGP